MGSEVHTKLGVRYTWRSLGHTYWHTHGVGYTRSGEWDTHGGVGYTRRSGVYTKEWDTHGVRYIWRGTHGVGSEVHTKWGMKYTWSGIHKLSEIHIRSGKWDVYRG